MVSNQNINNKNIQKKVPENDKVEIKEVSKVQESRVAITTKTEIKLRENCDTEHEEHESARKQKLKRRKPINKGKILGGKRETFEVKG